MIYDVLIVGSGGGALAAALSAKEKSKTIAVISENFPTRSQTCMAQGGINAAMGNMGDDDTNLHIKDTLKASGGIARENMVKMLCEDAKDSVMWLQSIGVPFSRTEDGKIAQRRLGGASSKRACYSQDYTGLKILHTLYDQCLKEDIEFINERFLLNFSVEQNQINGATFYNLRNGETEFIQAKSIIVATGGYSGIYYGFTTNTNQSTGDGIAAALRAGAKISNMEFIQFHPTALKDSGVLISESARGAGGKLVNAKEERFVDELKPRDEVSRAIWQKIEEGEEIFLDIRHLGEEFINENIPQERKLCKTYAGIDPVSELIPISPVAHYTMGGIHTDENMMSSINGLFAVGECSNTGVHGANRLGGNSLLEIISFGKQAGKNAAKFAQLTKEFSNNHKQYESDKNFIAAVFHFTNQINFYEKREFLGKILYRNCGIIREDNNLKAVLAAIRQMQKELQFMGIFDKSCTYNTNLIEFIKFGNSLEIAETILINAIQRCESRGAHFRSDFPKQNDNFKKESITWKEEGILCNDFIRIES